MFAKSVSAINGPNDPVKFRAARRRPTGVELGVAISRRASYVPANALDYVAGYCVANDVSEREFQLERGGTWYKGKSSVFLFGPWLVTKDEVSIPTI